MGRGACASGLDAGATRGLPCVVSREEEQQGMSRRAERLAVETSPRDATSAGWPGDSKRSTEGSMKDHTTYHRSAATMRGWGLCPPAAWHTTARTDNPARAGGSPGAALACPQPALTGPATAALAGRAGTSPRRSLRAECLSRPWAPPACVRRALPGRAPARAVGGRLPAPEAAQGGAGARRAAHAAPPGRQRRSPEAAVAGHATLRSLEQAQLLRRCPGCRACLGRHGRRRRRGGRQRCRRWRSHRRWCVLRLGRGLGLLALANARGDGLLDGRGCGVGRCAPARRPGCGRLCRALMRSTSAPTGGSDASDTVLGGAGQRGLKLVAQVRQVRPDSLHGQTRRPGGLRSPAAGLGLSLSRARSSRAPASALPMRRSTALRIAREP